MYATNICCHYTQYLCGSKFDVFQVSTNKAETFLNEKE